MFVVAEEDLSDVAGLGGGREGAGGEAGRRQHRRTLHLQAVHYSLWSVAVTNIYYNTRNTPDSGLKGGHFVIVNKRQKRQVLI